MEKEIFDKYVKAGKIASSVREASKEWAKPDVKILDLAEKIESSIKKKGGELAFPVNISINDIAAHQTAVVNDEIKISKEDVIKIDIGVHVDGYVGDTACTIHFDKKYDKLVLASKRALEEAIKLCKPNAQLKDISTKIEEVIELMGFKPIGNLTGHGLGQYEIHSDPTIPNIKVNSDHRFKKDDVIAIEPFATDGGGLVKESEPVMIFSIVSRGPVRNPESKKIMNFGESIHGLPFSERRLMNEMESSLLKIKLALRELRSRGILNDYPPLREVEKGMISQAEHTLIIRDPSVVTTI